MIATQTGAVARPRLAAVTPTTPEERDNVSHVFVYFEVKEIEVFGIASETPLLNLLYSCFLNAPMG
jgi:hypothetical protein